MRHRLALRRAGWLCCGAAVWLTLAFPAVAKKKGCPAGMVAIGGTFCIDRWEASLVEIDGKKTKVHPHYLPVGDKEVRAVTKKGVFPQAYISRDEAEVACKNAKKRLCEGDEWKTACKGKHRTRYPYGDEREPGVCNDQGISPLNHFYPDLPDSDKYGAKTMNDPRLDQLEGGLAKTGSHARCKNGFRVFDMVGNLHEWTADPNGTFRGGYFLDVTINGEGCDYVTTAHDPKYHDYSTGFRCCADL